MAENKTPAISIGDGRNGPGRAAPQPGDKGVISAEPAPDGIFSGVLKGIQLDSPVAVVDREAG